ncbi:MAG: hypothetical protein V4858_09820 [Pseudomonadota bacterium]
MEEYERYITVQEAAERLNRPESVVLRMLETGKLQGMLRAELESKDGTPIGFDYALLSKEGVARVIHEGGDDFVLEWTYAFGAGKAICKRARPDGIRVLWEPSLALELAPGPVESAQAGLEWSLKSSIRRFPGYRRQLYQVLKTAHLEGKSRPNAREVLDIWKSAPPADIEVMPDGIKYNDGVGKMKEADLKAIKQAIEGLTKRSAR